MSEFFKMRIYLFILRERTTCWQQARGAEREGEKESQASSVFSAEPNTGLSLMTVRSWPEPKSRVRYLTDWDTQASLKWVNFMVHKLYLNKVVRKKCVQCTDHLKIRLNPLLLHSKPSYKQWHSPILKNWRYNGILKFQFEKQKLKKKKAEPNSPPLEHELF